MEPHAPRKGWKKERCLPAPFASSRPEASGIASHESKPSTEDAVAESEAALRRRLPVEREKDMKHEVAPAGLHPREGPALLLFAFAVVLLIGLLSYRGSTTFGRRTDQ